MALPNWPADLPCQPVNGWSQALGENRRISRGEQGPPRTRRSTSKRADSITVTFRMTRNERARFERFYDEDAGEGALPFLMPDPGTNNWSMLTSDGIPITDHLGRQIRLVSTWVCMFGTSMPNWSRSGPKWNVSFDLVILP